ncbi:MAG TPA: DUF3159 domain-containing protein, partial [Acidimicrobiales bacterium]|nr:DUF3159 domain-containing protein [Acidimicrobiales bacterium]
MSTTHDAVDIGAGEERQIDHRRSRRRRQAPVMGDTEGVRLSDSPLVRLVGGWRGAFDGALPPVVFVAVNAAAGLRAEPGLALRWAVASAAAVALALVTVRLVRRETLKQAVRGLVGLTVAAVFASLSGEARDFFRPGIYVDAAYAVLFAGSAVVGRPLVGLVHAALYRTGARWRQEPRLRRVFVAASWGWSLVY